MDWKVQIRQAFASSSPDADVLEELAQHAEAMYASARAEGADVAEAVSRVERQIRAWTSDPAVLQRRARRAPAVEPPARADATGGGSSWLRSVAQDARYAFRLMRRQPAYAVLAIATMALGIAATTVLGSVAYGVLLKPLPWAGAPRLVRLYESRQGSTRRFRPLMTNVTFRPWHDSHAAVDLIGAWTSRSATLTESASPERMQVTSVTPDMFPMLQASPVLGRLFAPRDGEPGKPRLVVLSYGLWQERFGGRPDAIGKVLHFDGDAYTIVGVMSRDFTFPDRDTRAWIPFYVPPVQTPGKDGFVISMFQAIGRLRPGATPAQAAAEGAARGRAVPDPGPVTMAVFGSHGPVEVTAVPLLESLVGDVKPAILVLLVAVVLLLITATANVASLQLARATTRRRELAIRTALGAARGRLIRQTLVENLLLGLMGGAAGLALAVVMLRALPSVLPANFPRIHDISMDWRIQVFALAISIGVGIGCGLLPALHAARKDMAAAIAEDSLAPVGGALRSGTSRVRAAIMAAQVAIACVLLVGAALLARTFVSLLHANVGYDPVNVLTARVSFPGGTTGDARTASMQRVAARLTASGDASIAAFATMMPFSSLEALSSFPLRKRDGSSMQVQAGYRAVSRGYFAALGQPVIEGREFNAQDTATSRHVVIVNREFSRKYLEGRALGWTLPDGKTNPDGTLIVGIVENTVRHTVTDSPQPEMYVPAAQRPLSDAPTLIVRTTGDPLRVVPALRSIVQAEAPSAALDSVTTMRDLIGASLSQPRLYAVLLGTFAGFALVIAGVGLFGVLSYTVAQRAREIGVRSALGAQVSDIVRLVVAQSMTIAGAGLVAGLVASYWASEAVRSFLYGVKPHDAVTFGGVALLLLVVAALASVVPARRAASVDPVKVLRA